MYFYLDVAIDHNNYSQPMAARDLLLTQRASLIFKWWPNSQQMFENLHQPKIKDISCLFIYITIKNKIQYTFSKGIIKFQIILYATNVNDIFCFTLSSLASFLMLGSLMNVNWKTVMIQENLITNIHKFRLKIFNINYII